MYSSARLKIPWANRLASGGVMTFKGDVPGQAVYWKLEGVEQATGNPVEPLGSLLYARTKTDRACLSVNVYRAPDSLPQGAALDDYYDLLTVSFTTES